MASNFFDQFDSAPAQDAAPQQTPYAGAISSIESSGRYDLVGPKTRTGDRALGKYQVMSANVPEWTKEALGQSLSPQQFLADPKAQDAVFQHQFGKYVQKYGPEGAARAWFAGEGGMNDPNRRDVLGTSVADYSNKFTKALGFAPQQQAPQGLPPVIANGQSAQPAMSPAQPGAKNFFDQFDEAPQATPTPMDEARLKLAEGLQAGKNGDADIYRTAAFRTNQGVPRAGATDAAMNGATLGLGDEFSAAARAPIDIISRGESFDEAYQHNLAAERDRLDQYRKAHPIASSAAELAGSIIVPSGKAGAIRTGATTGAIYGAGNSEGDITQRAADAAVGGAVGGALGGAVSGVARSFGAKTPSAAPSIQELKAAAKQGYNSEAVTGLELAPQGLKDTATKIRAVLDNMGFDDVVATKAHGILKKLENIPDDAVTVTGRNLHSLQKTLGKAAGSVDPSERAAASVALRELNGYLEAIPSNVVTRGSADEFAKTMREANANYSAAMNAGRIDQKLVQAEIRAAAANSGMNVSNTIRQRMADIVANPKQQRGLTAEDIAAAKQIAEGTISQNLLRKAGNIMGGGGGIGAALTGGGGYAVAGPAGAAIPVVGMILRAVGNRMTINQAQKMSEAIRLRAPLSSASQKFEEKVVQFQQARNAKNAAAAALAARNLATNLRGSGFNVSTSDLMRSIQAPVAGRAENDQPNVPRPPGH